MLEVTASLMASCHFAAEGVPSEELKPIIQDIERHGGTYSEVLTFTERTARAHHVWIVQPAFVTASVTAGFILPEFQYAVKRIGEKVSDGVAFNTDARFGSNQESSVNVELEEKLAGEGGQPWAIAMDGNHAFAPRYLLGAGVARLPASGSFLPAADRSAPKGTSRKHISKGGNKKGSKKKKQCRKNKKSNLNGEKHLKKSGNDSNVLVVQRQCRNAALPSEDELFVQIDCSVKQTLMLSQAGSVWEQSKRSLPRIVNLPVKISAVACGRAHTLALSVSGDVFSWGSGYAGQLGTGAVTERAEPKQVTAVLGSVPCCAIRAGGDYSMAMSFGGNLFSWGCNKSGQLGNGTIGGGSSRPSAVALGSEYAGNVMEVACGKSHVLALCADGSTILSWGLNSFGQLGRDAGEAQIADGTPRVAEDITSAIAAMERPVGDEPLVKDVACGRDHSAVVTVSGRLFTWGLETSGQLGRPVDSVARAAYPFAVAFFEARFDAASVECGDAHTAVTTNDGRVYLMGKMSSGDPEGDSEPREVPALSCARIACGGNQTVALVTEWAVLIRRHCIEGNVRALEKILNFLEEDCATIMELARQHPDCPPALRAGPSAFGFFLSHVLSDHDGNGLLHLAALNRQPAVMQHLLIRYGGYGFGDETSVKLDFNYLNAKGRTALHCCAVSGASKCMKILLSAGAPSLLSKAEVRGVLSEAKWSPDTCLEDTEGLAAKYTLWYGGGTVTNRTRALMEVKRDPNEGHTGRILAGWNERLDVDRVDQENRTALFLAVERRDMGCIELLTQAGANTSVMCGSFEAGTALHHAVKNEDMPTALYLASAAASIVDVDGLNLSPLDYCSWADMASLKDHAFALNVRKELSKSNLRCWMDDWRLEVGGEWRQAIGEGLRNCEVVIFVASSTSVVSKWCLKELHLAKSLGKVIIPVIQEHAVVGKDSEFDTLLRQVLYQPASSISSPLDLCGLQDNQQLLRLRLLALGLRVRNMLQHIRQSKGRGVSPGCSSDAHATTGIDVQQPDDVLCLSATSDDATAAVRAWVAMNLRERALACLDRTTGVMDEAAAMAPYLRDVQQEVAAELSECWAYILVISDPEFPANLQRDLAYLRQAKIPVVVLYEEQGGADRPGLQQVRMLLSAAGQAAWQLDEKEEILAYLGAQYWFRTADSNCVSQMMHTIDLLGKKRLLKSRRAILDGKVATFRKMHA